MNYNYFDQDANSIDIFNDNCCWRCENVISRKNGKGICKYQMTPVGRVGTCDKYKGLTVVESIDKDIFSEIKKKTLEQNKPTNIFEIPKDNTLNEKQSLWLQEKCTELIKQLQEPKENKFKDEWFGHPKFIEGYKQLLSKDKNTIAIEKALGMDFFKGLKNE